MRPPGGKSSILIRFQLRLGSGSTRGSMAMNSPKTETSRRLRLRRSWTCQFKIELVRTTKRAPMLRAPFPETPTQLRARMNSFREIEPNRARTQEQRSQNRSWQTTIMAKCSSARRNVETVVVALEDTSETPQAFEAATFGRRSNSRRARSGPPRHRHCGACMRRAKTKSIG
jgi:hypothetical protein